MIPWIKEILGINQLQRDLLETRRQLQSHREFVHSSIEELKEYTRVDADVGFRGNNTVILTGVYRNKGYVQFYDVGNGEFEDLVEHLRSMKKHALIRNIDSPSFDFKGVFNLY